MHFLKGQTVQVKITGNRHRTNPRKKIESGKLRTEGDVAQPNKLVKSGELTIPNQVQRVMALWVRALRHWRAGKGRHTGPRGSSMRGVAMTWSSSIDGSFL
jgi:ribosomal 50S subunit-recycling heat shock protein